MVNASQTRSASSLLNDFWVDGVSNVVCKILVFGIDDDKTKQISCNVALLIVSNDTGFETLRKSVYSS